MTKAVKITLLLLGAIALTTLSHSQNLAFNGFCQLPGKPVVLSGINSTTLVQSSYPKCTVTVYNTGTLNLATIYSSPGGAGLSSTFQANIDGSWLFFAAAGSQCYDIVTSPSTSGGLPVMPSTFTYTGVCAGGGGGGGGGGGLNQNIACTSLDPSTVTDLSCANSFNTVSVNSSGSSSANLDHTLAVYYQGDAQQNIGGSGYMGAVAANCSFLLNGAGGSGAKLTCVAGDAIATGNPTGTVGELDWARGRTVINSGTTVTGDAVTFNAYPASIGAGSTISGDLVTFSAGNPSILGALTGKSYSYKGGGSAVDFAFSGKGGANLAVFAAPDTIPDAYCHILNSDGITVEDCWDSGTGSPNGVINAKVGSIYSRQDGGAGTSFYIKESGTGNTGWAAPLTASAGITNRIPVWTGIAGGLGNSACSDNGTLFSCTEPLSIVSSGAGFYGLLQGADNSANLNANTIGDQAPTAVTKYMNTRPGAAVQGVVFGIVPSASSVLQSVSGDSNHSTIVTVNDTTSISATTVCSTAICPVGTYRVNYYLDVTTACGTSGTYSTSLKWTDDQGLKSVVIPANGTGTSAGGVLTTTSIQNFSEHSMIIRSTGATAIQYLTTAVACGSGGPLVGKLYLSIEAIQ